MYLNRGFRLIPLMQIHKDMQSAQNKTVMIIIIIHCISERGLSISIAQF